MFRWYIIRTLLYKEVLRYRYNWGLLMMVAALMVMSALVAIGSRFKMLPGQGGADITTCRIHYRTGNQCQKWIDHLRNHPPAEGRLVFHAHAPGTALTPLVRPGEMAIRLWAPEGTNSDGSFVRDGWSVRYYYGDESAPGLMRFRDWFEQETNNFLDVRPQVTAQTEQGALMAGKEPAEMVGNLVMAFAWFGMYLLSFNLFITSTAEEREKRVLLGLLLSPASVTEVLSAKIIFYGTASVAVTLAVVGMYSPGLLLQPMLWLTVACGSVAYIAIGTVVVSLVRRQSTINTISMLYLVITLTIMMLSELIPLFTVLHWFLIENWFYAQMKRLVAGQWQSWMWASQIVLTVGTILWCVAAVWIFSRKATSIAQAR
jgi:hypothetical protein